MRGQLEYSAEIDSFIVEEEEKLPSLADFSCKGQYMLQWPGFNSSTDRTACDAVSPSETAASGFSTRTPLALGSVAVVGAGVVGVALPEGDGVAAAAEDEELLSCHAGNPGGLIANGRFGDETLVERPPPA